MIKILFPLIYWPVNRLIFSAIIAKWLRGRVESFLWFFTLNIKLFSWVVYHFPPRVINAFKWVLMKKQDPFYRLYSFLTPACWRATTSFFTSIVFVERTNFFFCCCCWVCFSLPSSGGSTHLGCPSVTSKLTPHPSLYRSCGRWKANGNMPSAACKVFIFYSSWVAWAAGQVLSEC